MGNFTVSHKHAIKELKVGQRIEESSFALQDEEFFVQLDYNEDDDKTVEPYEVSPGIWTIVKKGELKLEHTSFVQDRLLDTFVKTQEVTDKIDCFFRNLHVYKEEGIEVPKRGILLYGQPGGGKTSVINKVANKYAADGKTAVLVWTTDKFESYQVKDFVKSFEYKGVEKLILIVEDIGGTEIEQSRMRSDASLLSLLDNQEKTFTIPVLILATTNYPENMMGNLTNRPQRFDDKIEMPAPNSSERAELLKFFGRDRVSPEALALIALKASEGFTPGHIKEIVLRHRIYEKPMDVVIKEMQKEIEIYKKGFQNKNSVGIGIE